MAIPRSSHQKISDTHEDVDDGHRASMSLTLLQRNPALRTGWTWRGTRRQ